MFRRATLLILLIAMLFAAWQLAKSKPETLKQNQETIIPAGAVVRAMDGDSFIVGIRKFRLKGIDAPELHQSCLDKAGAKWQCGVASRGALISLLAQPGLSCLADMRDKFGRSLAVCSNQTTPDIAASQVQNGYAVSNAFNAMRDYPREEDSAKRAKLGIWRGPFQMPKEWRNNNPRNTQ